MNEIPVAKINCTKNDRTFTCDASSSFDLDGIVTEYSWNMGDGTILSGAQITYTYAMTGEFDITLSVLDQSGNTGVQVKRVTAGVVPPQILAFICQAQSAAMSASCDLRAEGREAGLTTVTMDWGDGRIEELPYDPTSAAGNGLQHPYAEAGTYHITATVHDRTGLSAMAASDVDLSGGGPNFPPIAVAHCFVGPVNDVNCDAISSHDPDGQIMEYIWEVPDLALTFHAPSMRFNLPANVPTTGLLVRLAVVDNQGASGMTTTYVNGGCSGPACGGINLPPIAMIDCRVNELHVNCDAALSSDPDGTITQYSWSVPELGINSVMPMIEFDLPTGGFVASVHLTVTDNLGVPSSTFQPVTGGGTNFPPVAVANCNLLAGVMVVCNGNTSHDPDGLIAEYHWEVPMLALSFNTATMSFPLPPTFPPDANLLIRLTVVDNLGATGVAETYIHSGGGANIPPGAMINCQILPGNIVQCNGINSNDPDGSIMSFHWEVPDLALEFYSDTMQFDLPTNPPPVGFLVRLTVTDNQGANGVATTYVGGTGENMPPVANINCTVNGLDVMCDSFSSYDPDGLITQYTWFVPELGINSSSPTMGFTLPESGSMANVNLTVVDNFGASGYSQQAVVGVEGSGSGGGVIAGNIAPVANLFCSSPSPLIISCDPSMSYDPDGYIVSYELRIGSNGTFENVAMFENIFVPSTGDYELTLRITDNLGAQSESAPIMVHVENPPPENLPPTVALTCSVPDENSLPLYVMCQSTAMDSDGTIISVSIDWGDGSRDWLYASPTNTEHYYMSSGEKVVQLTAQDDLGATSTASQTFTLILNASPVAAFNCFHINSLTIKCDASASTDDGSITSYVWNVGGILKSGISFTQQFLQEENIIISLTVTDDKGLSNSQDQWFHVLLDPDIKLPFASFEHAVKQNNVVSFNASESLFNGRIVSKFVWSFGDGTVLETTTAQVDHIYPGNNWYSVSLVTVNQHGQESETALQKIRVFAPTVDHPGVSGEQMLAGVDSDADGIRDDLQVWIDEYYGESQNKRNAFRQLASTIQSSMAVAQNPDEAKQFIIQEILDHRCINAIFNLGLQQTEDFVQATDNFNLQVFNTYERLNAYSKLFSAGQSITNTEIPVAINNEYLQECKFEVINEN